VNKIYLQNYNLNLEGKKCKQCFCSYIHISLFTGQESKRRRQRGKEVAPELFWKFRGIVWSDFPEAEINLLTLIPLSACWQEAANSFISLPASCCREWCGEFTPGKKMRIPLSNVKIIVWFRNFYCCNPCVVLRCAEGMGGGGPRACTGEERGCTWHTWQYPGSVISSYSRNGR
jgi:hypothetical protein